MNKLNIVEKKNELRVIVQTKKNYLTADEIRKESEEVFAKIEKLPEFQRARTILVYWSTPKEVATEDFINKYCHTKTVLLPVVSGNALKLQSYTSKTTLVKGSLGIWEPEDQESYTGKIDLAIIPGVAFDKQKNRMGRGRGYYDRLLNEINTFKIGVCFNCQLMELVPTNDNDIKMDMVISSSIQIN